MLFIDNKIKSLFQVMKFCKETLVEYIKSKGDTEIVTNEECIMEIRNIMENQKEEIIPCNEKFKEKILCSGCLSKELSKLGISDEAISETMEGVNKTDFVVLILKCNTSTEFDDYKGGRFTQIIADTTKRFYEIEQKETK